MITQGFGYCGLVFWVLIYDSSGEPALQQFIEPDDVPLNDIGTKYDLPIARLEHTLQKKEMAATLILRIATLQAAIDGGVSGLENVEVRLRRLEINLRQLEANNRIEEAA